MNDGCDVAPDDDDSCDAETSPPTPAMRILGVIQAALIVGLAALIVSALGAVTQAPAPEEFSANPTDVEPRSAEASRPAVEPRVSQESAGFPFAAVVPLRAGLRDNPDLTVTGAISPPPTAAVTGQPRHIVITRKGRPTAATTASDRRRQTHVTQQARTENPLTVVGRTASVMASTFARDLRALPSQISALFSGKRANPPGAAD